VVWQLESIERFSRKWILRSDIERQLMRLGYFHAPWCAVCHEKAPLIPELARAVELPLEEWDIDEERGRPEAERRRIEQVPTLALLDGERVRFRLVGSMITLENVQHLLALVTG
jgi:thiol-disulfide isomerase/thioredoxin